MADGMSDERMMSIDDVANITGFSAYTIRAAVRDGELRASKLRGRIRIDPVDFRAWVDAHEVEPESSAAAGAAVSMRPVPRTRPPAGGYRAAAKARRAA